MSSAVASSMGATNRQLRGIDGSPGQTRAGSRVGFPSAAPWGDLERVRPVRRGATLGRTVDSLCAVMDGEGHPMTRSGFKLRSSVSKPLQTLVAGDGIGEHDASVPGAYT